MKYKSNLVAVLLSTTMFATPVFSATTVNSYDDLKTELANDANAEIVLDMKGESIDLDSGEGVTVGATQNVSFENIGNAAGNSWTDTSYNIVNLGQASVNNSYFDGNSPIIKNNANLGGGIIQNQAKMSKITNSYFTNNHAKSEAKGDIWGGLVANTGTYGTTDVAILDLIQNVTFSNNTAISQQSAPHGGVLINLWGTIKTIDNAIFENNSMTSIPNQVGGAHGVAIDNNQGGIINKITNSKFINNLTYRTGTDTPTGDGYHASGAAIDNYHIIGEISNSLFERNGATVESETAYALAGAIKNYFYGAAHYAIGTIEKISNVQFIGNYAIHKNGGLARAGAIENPAGATIGLIENSSFIGNFVKGGINSSFGETVAGAIYNNGATIGNIKNTTFTNNAVIIGEEGVGGRGGAVYNTSAIGLENVTFDKAGKVTVESKKYDAHNDIYNTGTLTIAGNNTFGSEISGDGGVLDINGGTSIVSANISGQTMNLNGGTLKYTSDKYLSEKANNSVNFNGGLLDIANGEVTDIKLSKLSLSKESNIHVDADLANKTMDTLTADTIEASDKLNIAKLNLISDAAEEITTINFTQDENLLKQVNYTGATSGLTALSPVYTYDVAYDNTTGDFTFTQKGHNPAIYGTSVVNQTVGFLQQNIANAVFDNLGLQTLKPMGRASGDEPYSNHAWVSLFGADDNVEFDSFETVNSEMMSLAGGFNSDKIKLGDNYVGYGIYAGYLNGEGKYTGNEIDQEGGYIGLSSSLQNGNFVMAGTINGGFIKNEAKHSFGTDKYDTYWTGVSLKTGYDYHVNNSLTIQPNVYAAYSFVNSEDYTSKSGAKIKNDNLHLFEVAPGLKVNQTFANGWNGFAGAKYAFVMDNGGDTNVDSALLPNISVKDYVEYGLGLEKDIRFDWRLAATINRRDGGRQGWNGSLTVKHDF